MSTDPIVMQVREAVAELAKEAGNDIHKFFDNMRLSQEKYKYRLVFEATASHVAESGAAYRTNNK